jgi:hypothetical protein
MKIQWLAVSILAAGVAAADMPGGLVLRFSCDELRNNGALLPDVTGSNNNGRATGVRGGSGRLNGGCEFTGKDSFVQVPSAPLLESERVTVCLWLKTGKAEWPERTLLEKRQGDAGYALLLAAGKDNANRGRLRAAVGKGGCFSDAPVTDGAWHHAALAYDGETVRLYVDGAPQKQTAAWRGGAAAKGAELTLGMNRSQPSSKNKEAAFEGLLDEVLVFNRALGEAEVRDALSATRPRFTKRQVEQRLRELKGLYERGLLTKEFYDRKVEECEVSE